MLQEAWTWWVHSDAGLLTRIAIGVTLFSGLAWAEWRRKGTNAQRWREYLFLLTAVAAALLYGIINDQITVSISWEYFYYGKDLEPALGPQIPPYELPLRWEAAKVGMKATWTAGLILGVIVLFANNPRPRKGLAPLPYRTLYRLLPAMFLFPALCGIIGGLVGYTGGFVPLSEDFRALVAEDAWRPARFMCVYGIHLGGYVGGLLGGIAAAVWIMRQRKRTALTSQPLAV